MEGKAIRREIKRERSRKANREKAMHFDRQRGAQRSPEWRPMEKRFLQDASDLQDTALLLL